MRSSFLWALLVLSLLTVGCAQREEATETTETQEVAVTPEQIRIRVADEIHAVGDTISLPHPTTGEPIRLAFLTVHDHVMETPSGRQAVCVDFLAPDGTVYDVDYYLTSRDGQWVVTDAVIHKVGAEEVLTPAERDRLGTVQ